MAGPAAFSAQEASSAAILPTGMGREEAALPPLLSLPLTTRPLDIEVELHDAALLKSGGSNGGTRGMAGPRLPLGMLGKASPSPLPPSMLRPLPAPSPCPPVAAVHPFRLHPHTPHLPFCLAGHYVRVAEGTFAVAAGPNPGAA